jgi:hypothetical protein
MKRRAYGDQLFWARKRLGRYLALWPRQAGKTTTLADQGIHEMVETPGKLVIFGSASLNIGTEYTEKEVVAWNNLLAGFKSPKHKLEVGENRGHDIFKAVPDLKPADMAELFDKSKFEVRIWHSNSVCSRTKVIAANLATFRSWSGSVKLDELAFLPDLRIMLQEAEPMFSTDPTFNMVMATTLPDDYAHYSYELTTPDDYREDWPLDPKGNWFKSRAGLWVHRVTADDAYAAGRKYYNPDTRAEETPDENRESSLDKEGWDRSNRHKRPSVGTSALNPVDVDNAQRRGKDSCLAGEGDPPAGWLDCLGSGELTAGLDLASTEGKKSNPTSLTLLEKRAGRFSARLVLWWKTAQPAVTERRLVEIFTALCSTGRKVKVLNADATNDRLYVQTLRDRLRHLVKVKGIVSSSSIKHRGQELSARTVSWTMLRETVEENQIDLPPGRYVAQDFLRTKRAPGDLYVASVGPNGEHADTADGTRLALMGHLHGSGPVEIEPVRIASFGQSKGPRPGLRDLLQWAGKKFTR